MSAVMLLILNAVGVVMVIIINTLIMIVASDVKGKLDFKRMIEQQKGTKVRYRDIH